MNLSVLWKHFRVRPEMAVVDCITNEKILLVIFSLLLLIKYHFSYNKDVLILETRPKFTLMKPSNTTLELVKDNYTQLIDLKNFTFLLNPSVCDHIEGLLLLVSSKPSHVNPRELIRKTWAQQTHSTKLVFLLGIPPDETMQDNTTLSEQIIKESVLYGDIVQGTFLDTYRNLSYKHVMGLKWVAHHCHTAKYVLKGDDDAIVHSEALMHFLARDLSPWGARKLILCEIYTDSPVDRDNSSKWYVTKQEYEDDQYPEYCFGKFLRCSTADDNQ